jgi:hypothetical protein
LPSVHEDLPSRIQWLNAFLGKPGKEHPDRGHMLLNSCRRARVLFDVPAPIQELADGVIISDPRVLVANRNGKKFEVPFGRFRADIGDERWNLEGFGFDEA